MANFFSKTSKLWKQNYYYCIKFFLLMSESSPEIRKNEKKNVIWNLLCELKINKLFITAPLDL